MLQLDEGQRLVVQAPIEDRMLVLAGPGSGKTTTSIEKIRWILEQSLLEETDEIFVIVFSRSAAQAVEQKLKTLDADKQALVTINTLDSYARALCEGYSENFSPSVNFEKWVHDGTEILNENGLEEHSDIRHVIVDEFQDISGEKLSFLSKLFATLPNNCGITVFADFNQQIYLFDSDSDLEKNRKASNSVLKGNGIKTITSLQTNYRASSRAAKSLVGKLDGIDFWRDKEESSKRLENAWIDLAVCDEKILNRFLRSVQGNVAVLCRSNLQVALLADYLQALGFAVSVRSTIDSVELIPGWVAQFLKDRTTFEFSELEAWLQTNSECNFDVQELLSRFGEKVRFTSNELGTAAMREKLLESDHHKILISTIHQSKGLEFDNVLIAVDRDFWDLTGDLELFYVALTRSRGKTLKFQWNFPDSFERRGRFFETYWAGRRQRIRSILVRPDDIECPFSVEPLRLEKENFPGVVEFKKLTGEAGIPRYKVQVSGVTVGMTNSEFGNELKRQLGESSKYPNLKPVRFSTFQTKPSGVEKPGWHKIPAPFGFAELEWSK